MDWVAAVERLRSRGEAGVLVTIAVVRGHSPREAGAKMVVTTHETWGSVGGGNLEATAIERARELLADPAAAPTMFTSKLSEKAPVGHGVQCCGGEVTLLLEPLAVLPAVAIFGVGHVGLELARILARHNLELHLVDSRPDQLSAEALAVLDDPVARIHTHHVPVLPELVLAELPVGTHVLVMTHDHAEDAALIDAALRTSHLGSIGLIGSSAKWSRFRAKLADEGHDEQTIARVKTPIGIADLSGKEPATIAVSVAASLLLELERAVDRRSSTMALQEPDPASGRER
jgi:xanthine dehydrogenase accessory factor